jgi:hypothetical protein
METSAEAVKNSPVPYALYYARGPKSEKKVSDTDKENITLNLILFIVGLYIICLGHIPVGIVIIIPVCIKALSLVVSFIRKKNVVQISNRDKVAKLTNVIGTLNTEITMLEAEKSILMDEIESAQYAYQYCKNVGGHKKG